MKCFLPKFFPTPEVAEEIRIAVVGRTGSGLSQLIHDATGQYQDGVAQTASLRPYTLQIITITSFLEEISREKPVVLIDTPGFDYSRGNNEYDTFTALAKWTKQKYGRKAQLDGIIYMHNIWNEELYNRSPLLTSDALEQICGPHWREKVVFVNSHWSERVKNDGERRELRLKKNYWNYMLAKGSVMTRYEKPGCRSEALRILKLITG